MEPRRLWVPEMTDLSAVGLGMVVLVVVGYVCWTIGFSFTEEGEPGRDARAVLYGLVALSLAAAVGIMSWMVGCSLLSECSL